MFHILGAASFATGSITMLSIRNDKEPEFVDVVKRLCEIIMALPWSYVMQGNNVVKVK
jgi:hypothetical protein